MLNDQLKSLYDQFSDEEKKEIDERYAMLKSEYLTLQEIRKRQEVTQADIAGLLGIKQENVSRLEKRNDMKLSTLTDYIEALGGHIQIQAVFPENHVINIEMPTHRQQGQI